MSLIYCKECKSLISDQAATCPHCGAPNIPSDIQCAVNISRQAFGKYPFSAFSVYIDRKFVTHLPDHGKKTVFVSPGKHTITITIGKKVLCNAQFIAATSGIDCLVHSNTSSRELEVLVTEEKPTPTQQVNNQGCGGVAIAVILIILALILIYGITVKFDIVFVPVP